MPFAALRVLHIPEVLQEIVQRLDEATLSRTARVSTTLHDASIRILWSGKGRAHKHGTLLKALRGILPDDRAIWSKSLEEWDRFKHYSSQIRAIYINRENYWDDLFTLINNGDGELFPRLRHLEIEWDIVERDSEFPWMALGGSRIHTFEIRHSGCRLATIPALITILCQVAIRFPGLEELVIGGSSGLLRRQVASADHEESTSLILQLLANLRHLTWRIEAPIPRKIAQVLAALPLLGEIRFNGDLSFSDMYQGSQPFFPALRRLGLRDIKDLTPWFENLTNPGLLTHISLNSLSFSPPSFRCYNIVDITLQSRYSITWEEFRPLLSCKSVRRCNFLTLVDVKGLDDEALGALASSWPEIEDLRFRTHPRPIHGSPTVLGLAHFARSCPKLRFLWLTANANLRQAYGETWQDEHRRVMGESYTSRLLTKLWLEPKLPDLNVELTEEGLGASGLAVLIRRLWPCISLACVSATKKPKAVQAPTSRHVEDASSLLGDEGEPSHPQEDVDSPRDGPRIDIITHL